MWNPFKKELPASMISYSPQANVVGPDSNSLVFPNAVTLDDGYYPDTVIAGGRGNLGDTNQEVLPAYAGQDKRYIVEQPGYVFEQRFVGPTDASAHVPGTVYVNAFDGPVTGSAMDNYQAGNRQQLMATPPGAHGPVKGGQDYSQIAYAAYWQQAFASYSNEAATAAQLAAI